MLVWRKSRRLLTNFLESGLGPWTHSQSSRSPKFKWLRIYFYASGTQPEWVSILSFTCKSAGVMCNEMLFTFMNLHLVDLCLKDFRLLAESSYYHHRHKCVLVLLCNFHLLCGKLWKITMAISNFMIRQDPRSEMCYFLGNCDAKKWWARRNGFILIVEIHLCKQLD